MLATRNQRTASTTLWLAAALACSLAGCDSCKDEAPPPPPAAQPAAKPAELTAQPETPPPPAPPPLIDPNIPPQASGPDSEDNIGYPKEGWTKRVLTDEVALCVFSNEMERSDATLPERAKKQALRADSMLAIATWAPGCINPSCDDLPSLQCWIDREGDTLVAHSRFSSYHKDGSSCTESCQRVTAGCETAELPAGNYTLKYGERSMKVRIPSTLNKPCLLPK